MLQNLKIFFCPDRKFSADTARQIKFEWWEQRTNILFKNQESNPNKKRINLYKKLAFIHFDSYLV